MHIYVCMYVYKADLLSRYIFSLKKEGNSDTCHNMMTLEDIMLSEISPSQKDKCYMIPLM